MKANTIYRMAYQVKSYIEKKHQFPKSIAVNGLKYNYGTYTYYFTEYIKNGGKDVPDKTVRNNKDPVGDNLNESVSKNDYLDQVKRVSQFIKQNGSIPNYVTTQRSRKKARARDYIYAFARIIVYHQSKKAFPNTCKYDSSIYTTSSTSKYGHSKKSGCDNMGQNTGYYCGVHSLQEVIRNLYNIVVPQSRLASWCGTTSAGTSHQGLETGVAVFNKKYNKSLKVKWYNFSDLGWNGIKKIIDSKNQDVIIHNLYRNQYGHYEVINDVSTNINVQNSLGSQCGGGCYCGYIEYRTQAEYKSYISGISQKSIMVLTK